MGSSATPYLQVMSRDQAKFWAKRRVKKALTMAMLTCNRHRSPMKFVHRVSEKNIHSYYWL